MRELCYEEIMTTRVALPNFIIGCRMSEMRRRLLPSPTPDQQQSVRRNLFGPIDHEENFKFVQAELAKISQSDAEKWNFDFTENKPKDGRFKWEAVGTSEVPSAYQLPNLTSVNQSKGTCVVPSFIRSSKVETTPPRESSSSSSPSTSAVVDEVVDSVALTTTGSTTVTTTSRSLSTPSTASSVPTTQACSSSNFPVKPNKVTVESKKSLDNGPKNLINKPSEKLQQPTIKDMFKCKKRPLNGSSKVDSDEQPPTLVNKRQRTQT